MGRLRVSRLGLGCNQLGTTCGEAATADIIDAAIDHGANFFDTADEYGFGRSEEFVGRALEGRRSSVFIATKFGCRMDDDPTREGASPRWIARAVEDSLKRLRTDYIDLYQLHFPDPNTPIVETLLELKRLVDAGKVREVGCCNLTPAQFEEARLVSAREGLPGFVSIQRRLNLLRQEALTEFGPLCEKFDARIIPFFPLASGSLTGKYKRGQPPGQNTRLGANVPPEVARRVLSDATFDTLEALEEYAIDNRRTLGELALAWLTSTESIGPVIAGATSPSQVASNAQAVAWDMDREQRERVAFLASTKA